MIQYKDWSPSKFDHKGAFLADQQDWWVAPVLRTRDSDSLQESNFTTALSLLGGKSKRVQVHRFGHWANGWLEIILVHPRKKKAVEDLASRLEDYPVLDEEDFSRREEEARHENWKNCGYREFRFAVVSEFDLNIDLEEMLCEAEADALYHWFYGECNSPEISPEKWVEESMNWQHLLRLFLEIQQPENPRKFLLWLWPQLEGWGKPPQILTDPKGQRFFFPEVEKEENIRIITILGRKWGRKMLA